ncbi:MAG: hypothetical protein ACRD1K_09550, partial [Acidimicrobiales bacterium]
MRRCLALVVVGVVLPVLALGSLAWGCAGQATIGLRPATGVAGSSGTVSGAGFGQSSVDIRWGAATGPVIATAVGPTFSVSFTVPDAAAGVYYVVAAPVGEDALNRPAATAAFTVASPPQATQPVVEPAAPGPAPLPATAAAAPAPARPPAVPPLAAAVPPAPSVAVPPLAAAVPPAPSVEPTTAADDAAPAVVAATDDDVAR